jgi:3-isopropylmalate/(R)-2-methylmalate dehydratase small subunit
MKKVEGRVWRFDENVDTDQIIPAKWLVTGDAKELASHAFENVRPEFSKDVKGGDIIVGGHNFGCGSSREHAPRALIGAGIACVIAPSFARIFYRNSVNIGLPLIECDVDVKDGEIISVNFIEGKITDESGKEYDFAPMTEFHKNLMESGGLVEHTKRKLRG